MSDGCATSYSAQITAGPAGLSYPISLGPTSAPIAYNPGTRTFTWTAVEEASHLGVWFFSLSAHSRLVPANTQTYAYMKLTISSFTESEEKFAALIKAEIEAQKNKSSDWWLGRFP